MWGNLKKYVQNYIGPTVDKKYLILESDDWGTVRMPSKKVYNDLKKLGCNVDTNPFTKFDSLESNDDLERLFSILSKYKDKRGRHPIITADTIVANPDFEKIIENGFSNYEFEPFTDTLKKYPSRDRVMDLYREGIAYGLFHPEYHGREHVNINLWMKELENKNSVFRRAAEMGTFAIESQMRLSNKNNFMAALDYTNHIHKYENDFTLKTGLTLFNDIFGYKASSFIAPSYTWHSDIEKILAKNGIESIQGLSYQYIPNPGGYYKRKYHYTGQRNKWGQRYLVRNSFFEPSVMPQIDWIGKCLNDIDIAFRMRKPAIIGSHRINFIGSIFQENSSNNIRLLDRLFANILKKWPDILFITSRDLTDIINRK